MKKKKKEEKSSTNSSDKSGRKWHLMNVIIVSFPLVFHIINLPECSCISVWALTKSIQTLCCAVTQIAQAHTHTHAHTRTHTYTTPHLGYQSSTTALITTINTQQHRVMLTTPPFTVSVCGEFLRSLSFAALHFPCYFPTMHREAYQPRMIYKLSDALTVQFHTLAGRYNSGSVQRIYGMRAPWGVETPSERKMEAGIKQERSKE